VLKLPPLPSLRDLRFRNSSGRIATARMSASGAPRLYWMLLEGFNSLEEMRLDCPNLIWFDVHDAIVPMCVVSRCQCPLTGCDEAELAPDGTLRERHASTRD